MIAVNSYNVATLNALSRILIDEMVRDGFRMNFICIIPAAQCCYFGILVIITSKTPGKEAAVVMTKRQSVLSVLLYDSHDCCPTTGL